MIINRHNLCYYIIVLLAIFSLSGCNLGDQEELEPSYIYISDYDFISRSDEGTDEQKITHIWVNADGDFIGAYDLPRIIPLHFEGETEIIFNPGIVNNGISTSYEINEVMSPMKITVDLKRGEIDTLHPVFEYDEGASFVFNTDFESGAHNFNENLDTFSNTGLKATPDDSFEGLSGVIELTEDENFAVLSMRSDITGVPLDSRQKILELHFKTEAIVEFGLRRYDEFGTAIDEFPFGLNLTDEWKKVYLNYSPYINTYDPDRFKILIRAVLPVGEAKGKVMFDNIKFTHE